MRFIFRLAIAVLLFAPFAGAQDETRVVAVGDVHGNLDGLTAILRKVQLIDGDRRWIGGRATLVQTGDFLDRGPQSREVIDFLMALQDDADRRGGSVRISLGNHEVMNLMGDLRYLSPEDYRAFADDKSEERRRQAFEKFAEQQKGRGRTVDEQEWMNAHPPGFLERSEAFGPNGRYGRWLRSLPSVNRIGDSVFVHGGIRPALAQRSVNDINRAVRAEIRAFDQFKRYLVSRNLAFPFYTFLEVIGVARAELDARRSRPPSEMSDDEIRHVQAMQSFLGLLQWLSLSPQGPLWFREYATWSEEEGAAMLKPLLERWGVRRIVVGHTTQTDGQIQRRFGGMVYLIDTGMLRQRYPGGAPSALEITKDGIRAVYLDREADLN